MRGRLGEREGWGLRDVLALLKKNLAAPLECHHLAGPSSLPLAADKRSPASCSASASGVRGPPTNPSQAPGELALPLASLASLCSVGFVPSAQPHFLVGLPLVSRPPNWVAC